VLRECAAAYVILIAFMQAAAHSCCANAPPLT